MTNLRIAIQSKGRLTAESLSLLKRIGMNFEVANDQLISKVRNFPLEILFLRQGDIPEYVQDSVSDLGIVGENLLIEKKGAAKILQKLGFGQCQLVLAVPRKSKIRNFRDLQDCRIATSHMKALEQFLRIKKMSATLVPISGSVEIAPTLGVADAVCDLMASGGTLKKNGLKIVKNIIKSEAVLIGRREGISQNKKDLIDQILLRVRASLAAAGRKYVMMNAPKKAVGLISSLIPSLSSPTIVSLKDPKMVAIHSVIPDEIIWSVIPQLKKAGASGIIALPIEMMME